MDPLKDTMVIDLHERGPTLCIHDNTIYVLKVTFELDGCGDGCCSWSVYDITDELTNETPDGVSKHDLIIPILELSPEWDEFLRARGYDSAQLDLSPMF